MHATRGTSPRAGTDLAPGDRRRRRPARGRRRSATGSRCAPRLDSRRLPAGHAPTARRSPTAAPCWSAAAGCEITQRRDGFVHPGDPSFAYGWFVKRNPRTIAGVDRQGRTVLVTVDGRSTEDLGLSVPEAADVARSLGLVDAINLDGGGSTTMVVDGSVISHPSDATGERPVGDALVISPR